MGLRFYLTLVVLGLTAVIRTKSTGVSPDETYQQELTATEYTNNKLDGSSQEDQLPFYYRNNFDCTKHQYAFGMYADMDFQCQVYHVCHNNRKETFLCPHGTLFNQRLLVCDHWHSVNCQNTPSFYYVNEELGKVSNRTRYDGRDGPYSHRRFPEDYGQSSPYSPSYTTPRQGQQFPSSRGRSTPLPFPHSTTEAPPAGSYRPQSRFPSHSQDGRYYPQPPYDQQPQIGRQPGHQDRQYGYQDSRNNIQGPSYGNRQQNFNYDRQGPELGSRDSLYGDRQSRFNQFNAGRPAPGTQQNRDLTFTHYSQSGGQRTSQDRRANNTWPVDQRNTTRGSQYGRQPQPSLGYGQNYPENSLLGSRYNWQKPSTFQYGHQLPGRTTPGSLYNQPDVSQDGRHNSQVITSGLVYGNQLPSTTSPGQTSYGRSPGSLYDRDQTSLEHGQKQPEIGAPGFIHGRRDTTTTQYGRQQPPRPGSYVPPSRPHHPFTTHGGQIHPPVRTPDTYNHQRPSQYDQQPHSRTLGSNFGQPQPPFSSQHGQQQPQTGNTGSLYGKQPSTSQGRPQFGGFTPGFQHQPVTHHRQNQSRITSVPSYNQQRPIFPGGKPSQPGQPVGSYGQQQPSSASTGQGSQYKSQLGSQLNRTEIYGQQKPDTRFHQRQTPENIGKQPELGYNVQPLNSVSGSIPGYSVKQNVTSGYAYNRQGSQSDRESKAIQSPPWQQLWNSQRNQPFGKQPNIVQSQFSSQEQRGERAHNPANSQSYQYDWQKPGSQQYSFQQPHYQNLRSSRNLVSPQLTSSNDSFPGQGGHLNTVDRNRFWNHQSGASWNYTGNVPIGTQFGGELTAAKQGQDKNLKPILVYQHHIPVTINGNTTNRTGDSRQEVPVYKVYYVKGDQKEPAVN